MPVEFKRIEYAAYVLYLGALVTQDELAEGFALRKQALDGDNPEQYVLVIENIRVSNPIEVARWLVKYADPKTSHYVVVQSSQMGAVLAQRLSQLLPDAIVEVQPHLPKSVQRAREILRDVSR